MNRLLLISALILTGFALSCAPKQTVYQKPDERDYTESEETELQKKPLTKNELISGEIESRIRNIKSSRLDFNGTVVNISEYLRPFYIQTAYSPAWYSKSDGFKNKRTESLLNILLNSENEGLDPEDYNIRIIEKNISLINDDNINDVALFDVYLSNSLLKYATHMLHGNPAMGKFNPEDPYADEAHNLALILSEAVKTNRVEQAVESIKPKHPVYTNLLLSLKKYRNIRDNGGWPSSNYGDKLKIGATGSRVAILKKRLIVTGDLPGDSGSVTDKFDNNLENAVKRFQNRHNLLVDGVVGKSTAEALNIPVEEKIRKIELNLDMWRKMPLELGSRYVIVNIPFFKLFTFENYSATGEMKVIVGKKNWNTPIFSDEITYMEVNPYWNVPKSILVEDIIPKAKENPTYIRENNIKIMSQWGSEKNEEYLNIMNSYVEYIDWSDVDAENWPFRLRQEPGSGNPLGNLKFMFPNKHNVYLHDTPLKQYFNRTERSLSHGCIRVERPLDLADFLLKNNPDWSSEQLQYQIQSRKNKTVGLKIPVPVHIMYFTAWADGNETHFADDIYNIY